MSAVSTVDKKNKIAEALSKTAPADENVEIVFDFDKIDLFDLMEVMEYSATLAANEKSGSDQEADPGNYARFLKVVRTAYVSSSRPLTGGDFRTLSKLFWQSLHEGKDPNS